VRRSLTWRSAGGGSHAEPRHRHHLPLTPHLVGVLDHQLLLRGRGVLPLAAQQAALPRRQPLELAVALADRLLLLRRQGSELLPAAPQRLSLLRSELPPLLEALTCHRALLGTHLQPALAEDESRA